MADDIFSTLWAEALESNDRDAYVSDLVLSSIWNDPEDAPIPTDRIETVGRIWDVAHMTIRDICKAAGLKQTELSRKYCISISTVSDWCRGLRTPPDYVRLLLALQLNII